MKISIVIAENQKQIMMTPENDHERQALEMIDPSDTLQVVSKKGTYDDEPSHMGLQTSLSQGGVLRRYAQEESLMFVIEKAKK